MPLGESKVNCLNWSPKRLASVGAKVVPETPDIKEAVSGANASDWCCDAGTAVAIGAGCGFWAVILLDRMKAMNEVAGSSGKRSQTMTGIETKTKVEWLLKTP